MVFGVGETITPHHSLQDRFGGVRCSGVEFHYFGFFTVIRFDNVFPPDGLIQMLNTDNVDTCKYILFRYSFKYLNLIFTDYSIITYWCVLNETMDVAGNGSLGLRVHFNCFLLPVAISVSVRHDNYDYYWGVYVHGHSF